MKLAFLACMVLLAPVAVGTVLSRAAWYTAGRIARHVVGLARRAEEPGR